MTGVKADGTPKVRSVDDLTRSGCNPAAAVPEKLKYESLDELLEALRLISAACGKELDLWKADVNAAYRRIPVAREHQQFVHIVFKYKGQVIVAEHIGLPFGAVASVHHWERVGMPHFLMPTPMPLFSPCFLLERQLDKGSREKTPSPSCVEVNPHVS